MLNGIFEKFLDCTPLEFIRRKPLLDQEQIRMCLLVNLVLFMRVHVHHNNPKFHILLDSMWLKQ